MPGRKHITFSVPIEKQENGKTQKYKTRLINSVRFVTSSLSSLADNLSEHLRKGKCKDCKLNLEYMAAKNSLLTFKCVH